MFQKLLATLLAIGLILALSSCPTGTTEASGNVVTIDGQTITSPTTWTNDNLYPIVALTIILHGQENPCNASNPFALLRFRSRLSGVDHAVASADQRVG